MRYMFAGAIHFNNDNNNNTSDLSSWDVSSVASMEGMFENAIAFTSDLSHWNVSSVQNMERMFYNATIFQSNLSPWNITNVRTMVEMFSYTDVFDGIGVEEWQFANSGAWINLSNMFCPANGIDASTQSMILSRWHNKIPTNSTDDAFC